MTMSYRIKDENGEVNIAAIDWREVQDGRPSPPTGRFSPPPPPSSGPQYPYATLTMRKSIESPNFFRNGKGGLTPTDPDEFPTELFKHRSPQISEAFADRDLRHHMPTMIGMAMTHMGSQADIPMADSSLTKFSSAMSRKAVDMGIAKPHPNNPLMEANDNSHNGLTVPPRQTSSASGLRA